MPEILRLPDGTGEGVVDDGSTFTVTVANSNRSHQDGASGALDPSSFAGGPVNVAPAAISGNTSQGSVLTYTPGLWVNNKANGAMTVAKEWYSGGVATGQTGTTYTIGAGDAGDDIECREQVSDSAGTRSQDSNTITADAASAYPSFTANSWQAFSSLVTTFDVSIPAGVAAGQLILIWLSVDGTEIPSAPTGFSVEASHTQGTFGSHVMVAKVADGTEGGTTVQFGVSTEVAGVSCVGIITNHGIRDGFETTDIASTTFGSNGTVSPIGGFSPPAGSDDYLFVVAVSLHDDDEIVTGFPAALTPLGEGAKVSGAVTEPNESNGASLAVAWEQVSGDTSSSGTWSYSGSDASIIFEIAIRAPS